MPIASINTAGNGNNNPIAARDLSGNNNVKKTYFQGNIAMKYQLPFVKGLSVKLNASYLKNYTMQKKYFLTYDVYGWNQTTRQGNVETGRIALMGVHPNYTEVETVKTADGRFVNHNDLKERRKVIVIHKKTAFRLPSTTSPK